jgi:starch phosphorylase
MEIALDSRLPTYSGGLGVLAGDFLRSAADLEMPLVAVTLAYRDGYFRQVIDGDGHQNEAPVSWDKPALLERLTAQVRVEIDGREVVIGAWRLVLTGVTGGSVAIMFLDTDLPENEDSDRDITNQLYGGDDHHRLRQEVVLGIGGVSMLRALGYSDLVTFHMNEGHAALLTLRLLEEEGGEGGSAAGELVDSVRSHCVFTTHTPVPAGHDRFPTGLVRTVLGERRTSDLGNLGLLADGVLNMTTLGVRLSRYVNAVSLRHREVTAAMMPGVDVTSITNGVHHVHWASEPMRRVFDEHLVGWRDNSAVLRQATEIPLEAIGASHAVSKRRLCDEVERRAGAVLDEHGLTIGLARRVTSYKRTMLLFSNPERLAAISEEYGPLQVVCSGKAHPRDEAGKQTIATLVSAGTRFGAAVRVVFLENYDLDLAAVLCAGSDVWLNTPLAPLEASGTSGMKAAVNGVPSLSILDGWWIEGCIEGVTGWSIGAEPAVDEGADPRHDVLDGTDESDADSLYDKLGRVVAPMYFGDPVGFLSVRRNAIALNGSEFSTDRMAREYATQAYHLDQPA